MNKHPAGANGYPSKPALLFSCKKPIIIPDCRILIIQPSSHEIPQTPLSEPDDDGVIEIREKMFIAQTNDIYFNAEDYLGKTLSYEGMFDVYEVPETGVKYYSVFRYGPGCCGIDANAGFEVMWDKPYPEPNDWVRAEGVLEEYDEDGYKYLRLALTSLEVLPTRGAEYVSQ